MKKVANQDHVFYRNARKYYPQISHGQGIYLYDAEGKRYIDGSGGAAVVNIGHGVREITEAMVEQANKVSFTHGTQFTSEAAIAFAERLTSLAPQGLTKVYFLSGGSEAVETAIKLARQYHVDGGKPEKYKVISRWTSYHGNTLGALALSGHTKRRRYYLPLMQHTPHIAPAYCYRCPFGLHPESCSLECAEDLERTILYEGPDSISAFIAEPIVGAAAGVLVPRDGYFQRIREICNQHDILLIVDEVMTGIGRTGKNFGIDHWEVTPDFIVAAKGLASGYSPIFCVIAKEEIHRTLKERSGAFVHGHTYSQNPLSCAVGLAVLSYLEDNQLIARCAEMGRYFLDRLQMLRERRIVGDVRGRGLFAGVEYVKDKKTKESFDPGLKVNGLIGDTAFDKGLITYPGGGGVDGVRGDHTLLAPPFIITRDEIDEVVGILDESIAEVEGAII